MAGSSASFLTQPVGARVGKQDSVPWILRICALSGISAWLLRCKEVGSCCLISPHQCKPLAQKSSNVMHLPLLFRSQTLKTSTFKNNCLYGKNEKDHLCPGKGSLRPEDITFIPQTHSVQRQPTTIIKINKNSKPWGWERIWFPELMPCY